MRCGQKTPGPQPEMTGLATRWKAAPGISKKEKAATGGVTAAAF
jgi:hypothetical protein